MTSLLNGLLMRRILCCLQKEARFRWFITYLQWRKFEPLLLTDLRRFSRTPNLPGEHVLIQLLLLMVGELILIWPHLDALGLLCLLDVLDHRHLILELCQLPVGLMLKDLVTNNRFLTATNKDICILHMGMHPGVQSTYTSRVFTTLMRVSSTFTYMAYQGQLTRHTHRSEVSQAHLKRLNEPKGRGDFAEMQSRREL